MMPVKGLQAADITLPRLKLHTRKGIYFSAIVLSMWDNIHGPKIIAVWEGDDSRGAVSEGKSYKSCALHRSQDIILDLLAPARRFFLATFFFV